MERFVVKKKFGGNKYRIGQIVSCNQDIDYNLWQYFQDKLREGALEVYMAPENKMAKISEYK